VTAGLVIVPYLQFPVAGRCWDDAATGHRCDGPAHVTMGIWALALVALVVLSVVGLRRWSTGRGRAFSVDHRALAACLLVAVAALAADRDFAWSPYADVVAALSLSAALVGLGWFAGWPALWMFSLSLLLTSLIYTNLFWADDPTKSGIDDLEPVVIVLALPVAWIAIAAGVVGRRLVERRLRGAEAP
jgi:hypothetical protein